MAAILPVLMFVLAARGAQRGGASWRTAMMIAAVVVGMWVVVGTEALSAGRWLTRGAVVGWWGAGVMSVGVVWAGVRMRSFNPPLTEPRGGADPWHRFLVGATGLVLLVTLLLAVFTPVNTWDSLQYHLPRQVFWIQQESVEHYPARDLRQLEMPPFAEFVSVHLMLLSGGDGWTNLIQWAALALSAVAASLTARELGLAARGQALAAMLAVTVPSAATQATNGKNDVVLGLWMLALFWLAARVWAQRRVTAGGALLAGAVLGLGVLTKGTAYVFALPTCLLLGAGMLRAHGGWRRGVALGAVLGAAALALNAGHFARNYAAFGSPISLSAERGGFRLAMEDRSPSALASNIVRNLAIHTGTPWEWVNAGQTRAIGALHAAVGQDPSDPRTTIREQSFEVRNTWWHDGNSPAPGHLVLGGLVLGVAVFRRRVLRGLTAPASAGVPLLGLLLFCIVLKWQPWHARLHIPGLMLLAPVGAAVVMALPWRLARVAVVGLVLLPVWPALAVNEAKPLIGERSVWRADEDSLRRRFRADIGGAVDAAAAEVGRLRPRRVGLYLVMMPQEYTVLRAVRGAVEPDPVFEWMRGEYGRGDFGPERGSPAPDVVLAWNTEGAPAELRWHTGELYRAGWQHGALTMYRPAAQTADIGAAFVGWEEAEGLHAAQGPFPDLGLPVVRWGFGERTRLHVQSEGGPAVLELAARTNVPGQEIRVEVNGAVVGRAALPRGREFTGARMGVELRPGENRVDVVYWAQEEGRAPPGRAVLYRTLRVMPE